MVSLLLDFIKCVKQDAKYMEKKRSKLDEHAIIIDVVSRNKNYCLIF